MGADAVGGRRRRVAMPPRVAGPPPTCRPPPHAEPGAAPAVTAAALHPTSAGGVGARRRNAGEPGPAAAGTRRAAYPGSRLRVLIKPHPCPSRRGGAVGGWRGGTRDHRIPPSQATALPGQVAGERREEMGFRAPASLLPAADFWGGYLKPGVAQRGEPGHGAVTPVKGLCWRMERGRENP